MKVCEAHIKLSGLKKRQLEIVPKEQCELCQMDNYFNDPSNPSRMTQHDIIQMYKKRRGSK